MHSYVCIRELWRTEAELEQTIQNLNEDLHKRERTLRGSVSKVGFMSFLISLTVRLCKRYSILTQNAWLKLKLARKDGLIQNIDGGKKG